MLINALALNTVKSFSKSWISKCVTFVTTHNYKAKVENALTLAVICSELYINSECNNGFMKI